MDIKFGSAVVKNRFNFNFLGTQHVYCVHITLEMPLKHGSVCQFFRSDLFLSQHGKKQSWFSISKLFMYSTPCHAGGRRR